MLSEISLVLKGRLLTPDPGQPLPLVTAQSRAEQVLLCVAEP